VNNVRVADIGQQLREEDVDADPVRQFADWFTEEVYAGVRAPEAAALATASADGSPSVRMVLVKRYDDAGFVFFTNYESRKGRELAANPYASLLFYWIELERQVRVEGRIVKTSAAESDTYFASRPLGSRIGAWASNQSQLIESRSQLETREREISLQYGDQPPRPPHWGGYRLVPEAIEFWQGRPSRLHDRLLYTRASETGDWHISRLSP
jgi:pyridoxamine 5'-phosphate oxidase